MGEIDIRMKVYMSKPERFADLFNYHIYGGEPIIKANALTPLDTNEKAIFERNGEDEPRQRFRDLIRLWSAMKDGHAIYAILGLEAQAKIDYMMAVRTMVSDAMNYWTQAKDIADKNRSGGATKDNYVSGFGKEDRLLPVITLVLYLGNKPWDGATDIHGILAETDVRLLSFVPNYKMNLIGPGDLSDEDLGLFQTDVGDLLEFIKISDDKEKLIAHAEQFRPVDPDTVALINLLTDAGLKYDVKEGKVDMCRAIQELRAEERNSGRAEGRVEGRAEGLLEGKLQTLINLVLKGKLTVGEAAEEANMTVEEFENKTGLKEKLN